MEGIEVGGLVGRVELTPDTPDLCYIHPGGHLLAPGDILTSQLTEEDEEIYRRGSTQRCEWGAPSSHPHPPYYSLTSPACSA